MRLFKCFLTALFINIAIIRISAATSCEQFYNFFCQSEFHNNLLFWITEDISGECHFSLLHLLYVNGENNNVSLMITEFKEFKKWDLFKYGIPDLSTNQSIKISNNNGLYLLENNVYNNGPYSIDASVISISKPDNDLKIEKEFDIMTGNGQSNIEDWNNTKISGKIQLPNISNVKFKLMFYYPKGLYINYEINDIYYFPESEFILIFTKNKKLAAGLDTMNGYLLIKLLK